MGKRFCPYLYGHPCDVHTDHEALKSLLYIPQPSGKLAHWGWPSKTWICIFTTSQEARTRTQMSCHVTLLLLCSRVYLSPMLVNDCAIGYCSDRRASCKEWGWQTGQEAAKESWAFSSQVLGSGCLTRKGKTAHEKILNSFQYEIVDNILHHTVRTRLWGWFLLWGPDENVWQSSQ